MRRGRFLKIAVMMILAVTMLSGCGAKEAAQTENIQSEENSESVAEQETMEEQVEAESEVTEEGEEENVADNTMEARLTELGLQGICLVVWNEATGTEYIIKDGDSYEEQEGDRFFVCTPSMMIDISQTSNVIDFGKLGQPLDNYCEIFFEKFEENKDIEIQIGCTNGEESNINFTMTKSHEESGSDWAKALGFEEPKIVVWNDTTGLRKELEEGETYQLSKDDWVAMYTPENYIFDTSNAELGNIAAGERIAVLRWNLLDLGERFDFEISAMHVETYDTVTLHVTLLPPIE